MLSVEDRISRIEEKVSKIEEWIEEEQGLIDALTVALIKVLTTGDPSLLELADTLRDKMECASRHGLPDVSKPPSLSEVMKMLADPEVRRGLYTVLWILKSFGACSIKR